MRKSIILIIIGLLIATAGCGGGEPPTTTEPPQTTVAPTTPPPTSTVPPITPAPTPAPGAYFADTSTDFLRVVPGDIYKIVEIPESEYFALPFPSKTTDYLSDRKATYKTVGGAIYVAKFKTSAGADFFFKGILNKIDTRGERAVEKTVTLNGNSLEIVHRYKYNDYLGSFVKKGIFVYFFTVGEDDFATETYIQQNMDFLFLPVGEMTESTTTVTKTVDLFSTNTYPGDLLPSGADETGPISDATYDYTLRFPKTVSYEDTIQASYKLPEGTIYILKYRSPQTADSFWQSVKDKIARVGNDRLTEETLSIDGKSLTVYHKVTSTDGKYRGTFIEKGLFVMYIEMWTSNFEADGYIEQNMPYLFE